MKQFYKMLLVSALMINGLWFQVQSANSTWTPTATITMKVGEFVKKNLPLGLIGYHWEASGDAVALQTYGDLFSNYALGNTHEEPSYAYIYAVKPGEAYVTAAAFQTYGSPDQVRYIYKIVVTDDNPTTLVMQHQLHLEVGKTHTLSPRLLPSGTSTTYKWYSSNTSVATVSSAGKITAKAVGDATITCITANGLREDCEVTVTPTLVSNLTLNQNELAMNIGDQYQLSAGFAPESATFKKVTWTSMNPDVVSVDANGKMSCLANGWSVVLATTTDGSNLTAGCFVRVGIGDNGDVDWDGSLNVSDVIVLIDYILHS